MSRILQNREAKYVTADQNKGIAPGIIITTTPQAFAEYGISADDMATSYDY